MKPGIEGVWACDPVTGEWDPDRPREPPPRTLRDRICRLRCWFRGYHVNSPTIGKFRYDVSGMCFDCGKVGSGIEPDQD
jgi:hypothetical protein